MPFDIGPVTDLPKTPAAALGLWEQVRIAGEREGPETLRQYAALLGRSDLFLDGFPKPGEMVGMTGTHALEACERAMINVVYQYAHDSGRLGVAGAQWEIHLRRCGKPTRNAKTTGDSAIA